MSEIKQEKSIFEILAVIRNEITNNSKVTMSGHNDFQNFDFFQLKDIVPIATKLFNDYGMCPMFNIVNDGNGVEIARLDIVKGAERITFQVPTAEPSGNNAIQCLGAKITYLRRYLYLIALDLVENDEVDAHDNSKDVKKEPKATPNQVKIIREKYDNENIAKIIEYYKVDSLEDLKAKDASVVINRKG